MAIEDAEVQPAPFVPPAIVTNRTVVRGFSAPTSREEVIREDLVRKILGAMENGWSGASGLAAIQIGVPLRVALYIPSLVENGRSHVPVVMINPRITSRKDPRPFNGEGCMSLPYERHTTWRYNRVLVHYETLDKDTAVSEWVEGKIAQVVQHEIDHMDGILNIDRLTPIHDPGLNDPCSCGSGVKFKRCCR